jgi:hypothetical protein
MLQILRGPGVAPSGQVLEKDVGATVEKDHEGFGKLGRGQRGLPAADDCPRRFDVPRPAKFGKAAHISPQRQQSVPEENSAFDEMRQAVEDVVAMLNVVSIFDMFAAVHGTYEESPERNKPRCDEDEANQQNQPVYSTVHDFQGLEEPVG